MDTAEQLQALFRQENRLLVGWLAKKTNDREQAEDIAQQVYLELWVNRDSIRLFCGNLLYRTAYHRFVDSTRPFKPDLGPLSEIRQMPVMGPGPETLTVQRLTIKRAMANLSPEQRALVTLKAQGWKDREIGVRLGVSLSAVKRRYARAVERNTEPGKTI